MCFLSLSPALSSLLSPLLWLNVHHLPTLSDLMATAKVLIRLCPMGQSPGPKPGVPASPGLRPQLQPLVQLHQLSSHVKPLTVSHNSWNTQRDKILIPRTHLRRFCFSRSEVRAMTLFCSGYSPNDGVDLFCSGFSPNDGVTDSNY